MKKREQILFYLAALTLASCGIASPPTNVALNHPYVTRVIPGDEQFTVSFEAQNNEEYFAGYTIYFNNDRLAVKKYIVLSTNLRIPTIEAQPAEDVTRYMFTIQNEVTYYSNTMPTNGETNATTAGIQTVAITNGEIYYVWVGTYEDYAGGESVFLEDAMVSCSPRPEENGVTMSNGTSLAMYGYYAHVSLVTNSEGDRFLTPVNGTEIQTYGLAGGGGLTNLVFAPTNGYHTSTVRVVKDGLYALITSQTNYAKIYVTNVESDYIVIDYCYQLNRELRSY